MLVAVVDDGHAFTGTHHVVRRTKLVERVPQLEGDGGWAMVFTRGRGRRRRPAPHRGDGHDRAAPRREMIDRILARRKRAEPERPRTDP